jgi:stage III sporulation protein AB
MWMKRGGIVLVMTASLGYVYSAEKRLLLQKRQLEQFHLLLSLMEQEICVLRLPIPLVLEHCSRQLDAPYGGLCDQASLALKEQTTGDACGVWYDTLHGMCGKFVLDDTQMELLRELGQVLGMEQLGVKEDLFSVYRLRLQALTDTWEAVLAERRKICRYGGILTGIFLIILFI